MGFHAARTLRRHLFAVSVHDGLFAGLMLARLFFKVTIALPKDVRLGCHRRVRLLRLFVLGHPQHGIGSHHANVCYAWFLLVFPIRLRPCSLRQKTQQED